MRLPSAEVGHPVGGCWFGETCGRSGADPFARCGRRVDALLGKPVRLEALRQVIAEVTAGPRVGATPPEANSAS